MQVGARGMCWFSPVALLGWVGAEGSADGKSLLWGNLTELQTPHTAFSCFSEGVKTPHCTEKMPFVKSLYRRSQCNSSAGAMQELCLHPLTSPRNGCELQILALLAALAAHQRIKERTAKSSWCRSATGICAPVKSQQKQQNE